MFDELVEIVGCGSPTPFLLNGCYASEQKSADTEHPFYDGERDLSEVLPTRVGLLALERLHLLPVDTARWFIVLIG